MKPERESDRLRMTNALIRLERRIYEFLDENDFNRALGSNLDRWNKIHIALYCREPWLSPGEMLNRWYESRRFDSLL